MPAPLLPDLDAWVNPYSWTIVAQVCRYWRQTAISFPTLWTNVDARSPLGSLASLDRSTTSLIRVYLRDAVHQSTTSRCLDRARLLQTIAYHSHRFVQFHVQPTFRYGPAILQSFQNPAPKLEALSIMLNTSKDESHALPTLFDGCLPNLRYLTLANFSSWSVDQFGTNLTHVCLMDQPLRRRMPMKAFLDFLANLPQLEELALIDAGPSVFHHQPGATDSTDRIVPFHHLKTLHIGDWPTPQSVANFLRHLVLPPTTKILIWGDCLFRQNEAVTMLLPPSLEHLHPLHHLTALHLTYRPAIRDYPQLVSVQNGILVVYLHFAMPATEEMMHSIFRPLDLRHIEQLTIGMHSKPELPKAWWGRIFKTMPRLCTLNILRCPSRPILSALSDADELGNSLCPSLTLLTITDDRAVSSILLFLFAEDRAQRGTPLQRLQVISRANMYSYRLEDDMHDLRNVIAEVECIEDEQVDVRQLAAGWPTEMYRWVTRMREGRIRGSF